MDEEYISVSNSCMMDMRAFCKDLPKIELHAHLNGSLSNTTMMDLHRHLEKECSESAPDIDWGKMKDDIQSLSACFKLFDVAHALTIIPSAVRLATASVIKEFAEDNVIYLELRSTLRVEQNMTKEEYLEAMVDSVLECRRSVPQIVVKIIVSINRGESVSSAMENVTVAIAMSKKYPDVIVGVDLSGNPVVGKFTDFKEALDVARGAGLQLALHCGEVPNLEEVAEILDFRPDRLGHATCVHVSLGGSADAWDRLLASAILVETCFTSNLKCGTVKSPGSHHVKLLHDAGHPLAVCTDDKGVFNTTLSEEYARVAETFSLDRDVLCEWNLRAAEHCFATPGEKTEVSRRLLEWRDSPARNPRPSRSATTVHVKDETTSTLAVQVMEKISSLKGADLSLNK